MVQHVDFCQLSASWHGQQGPRALQVALCADAIRPSQPGLHLYFINKRLRAHMRLET